MNENELIDSKTGSGELMGALLCAAALGSHPHGRRLHDECVELIPRAGGRDFGAESLKRGVELGTAWLRRHGLAVPDVRPVLVRLSADQADPTDGRVEADPALEAESRDDG